MILFDGKTYESSEQGRLLEELSVKIPEILSGKTLDPEIVIDAVVHLRQDLLDGKFNDLLADLPEDVVSTYKKQAVSLMSEEQLHAKIRTELGDTEEYITDPVDGFSQIRVRKVPLGVIFHISAGNMDFLPAYSVVEGLLAGNINILKLPSADNGLTIKLLLQLIEYRKELTDYIFVFDTSSSDIQGMRKMAGLCHGISVWGSDTAIEAVRNLAPTGAKIIEWGQKLGFCYITNAEQVPDFDKEIDTLAHHIATTKQLLCSSCQVIYIDTEDMNEVRSFGERFLPLLEKAANENATNEIGIVARDTLVAYTRRLMGYLEQEEQDSDNVLRGRGVSVIIASDSRLELSPMMCNVLVKPLPRKDLGKVLFEHRHHLQTAGLICPDDDRESLSRLFTNLGIVRVTKAGDMSAYFPGESHDGDYALSRYVRTVNIEE